MKPLKRRWSRSWVGPTRGWMCAMGVGWLVTLVLVVLIGTGSVPARAQSVSMTSGAGTAGVSVVLPKDGERSPAETVVDIVVEDLHVETVEANHETFHVLGLSGYTTTLEVGKPQLPAIRKTVGLPDGTASVTATVVSSACSEYPGFKVYPVQEPLTDGQTPAHFAIDHAFYARDHFYPSPFVRVGKIGVWRDVTVVTLEVVPVQFNPATGMLRVYDRIRVKLEAHPAAGLATTTAGAGPKTVEAKFDRFYRDEIINYDALGIAVGEPISMRSSGLSTTQGGTLDATDQTGIPYDSSVKYLCIRHEDCSDFSTLRPLLEWHKQCGLPYVSVVKSGIQTTEAIKNTILSWYNAHPELEFVLLVGDLGYLPWYPNWGGDDLHHLPGDHWYACLTGGDTPDLWPDIAVGRLPVRNDLELQIQVQKILTYAKNPPEGNWLNTALLIAHKQLAPGKYQGCKEDIRNATYSDPFDFITAYGADPGVGGDDATNADINDAINAGVGIVNYRGHGAYGFPSNRPWGTFWGGQAGANYPASWNESGEQYWATDAQGLENSTRTPVVFSISCMNNALDNPTFDCLGRAFVMQNAGAVAFLGASRPSYTTPNDDFDRELFDAIGNEGIRELGWILNDANTELLTAYGEDSLYMNNLKIYLWLGDPAMRVWGHEPDIFTVVEYPDEVSTGQLTVRTGWTIVLPGEDPQFVPIPHALVTLQGCGIYTYQETGGDGEATFNFVPAFMGQMQLTVTKADYRPYQDTIQIVPLENKITNIQFSPVSPGSLCNGDKVFATFDYTTTDPDGILVFVRPYTNGWLTPNYGAHGSGLWPYPKGSGDGWFTVNAGDVTVDQVRFQVWDHNNSDLLLELFEPVDFTYGSKVHNVVMSPVSPATLKWHEPVNITFDYFTCQDDVQVYFRPYTNGSLTPHYSAHGSPWYPKGRGTGDGYFTITSGEVTVDAVHVTMMDQDQNLLYEEDLPVSYHFEGNPVITVNPAAIEAEVIQGETIETTLGIGNTGQGELHYALRDRVHVGALETADTTDGPASAETTLWAPTTDETAPDAAGQGSSNQVAAEDGTHAGGTDGLEGADLRDLTAVTIAFDLSHGEKNPVQLDLIKQDVIARGAQIVYLENGPITSAALSAFDVLWVNESVGAGSAWTADERAAVQTFVESGGGLLIYGDEPGAASDLAALFGVTYTNGGAAGYTQNIVAHAITQDVSELYLPGPLRSLALSAPASAVVLDREGNPSIAVAEPGDGKVVFVCDDYFWGAYLERADNRLMGNLALDWLVPPDCPWLSEGVASGSVPTNSADDEVSVYINTTGLDVGDYEAQICIANDDPAANPVIVPVHVSVLEKPEPDIWIIPKAFSITQTPSSTGMYNLTIGNNGQAALTYAVNERCIWLQVLPKGSSGEIAPGGQVTVSFEVDTSSLLCGGFDCNLSITSNDPNEGSLIVPVHLEVADPVMAVFPNGFSETLAPDSSGVYALTVGNKSACGDLMFRVGLDGSDCGWLNLDPRGGQVPPGEKTTVQVAADATGLGCGAHTCNIVIQGNDPDNPETTVPFTLTVQGPDVWVDPAALEMSQEADTVESYPVLVGNDGCDELSFNVEESCAWLAVSGSASGTMAPGKTQSVSVQVDTTALTCGRHCCDLTISTNDPDENPVVVPVCVEVTGPADVSVAPTALKVNLPPLAKKVYALVIRNTGCDPLELSVVKACTGTWLTVAEEGAVLGAGESMIVDVVIKTDGLSMGTHCCTVAVKSKDPDEPVVNVPVCVTVTPCTADQDVDYDVDGGDLAAFAAAYAAGADEADLNADGKVTLDDVKAFSGQFGRTNCLLK